MPFHSIRAILPSAIKSAGVSVQVEAAQVVVVATDTVVRLWGEERAALVTIVSFHEGTLKCRSRSGAASQTLKTDTALIMNAINRTLGARVIRTIRVES